METEEIFRRLMKKTMDEITDKIRDNRNFHIEMMCCAFLKLTDIPVAEAELVEECSDTKRRWFFRRRQEKL